jgi:hypothetical protein
MKKGTLRLNIPGVKNLEKWLVKSGNTNQNNIIYLHIIL